MAAGEVEAHAGGQFADTTADLEQAQAQRVEVERRVALAAEPPPQGVEEPVGGGMQDEAELVGPEAVVAQGFRWGLLRSVKDLRKGPCRSATTGPRGRFCSVRTVERGSCDRLIRWPFGKNTPSQQAPTEPARMPCAQFDRSWSGA